jgi:hypothetical protein
MMTTMLKCQYWIQWALAVSSSQGLDVAGQAPQTIQIDDLNIPQPNPPLIATVKHPTVPQMEHDEPTQIAQPMETTGL